MPEIKAVSVKLPAVLFRAVKRRARALDQSVSAYIRTTLRTAVHSTYPTRGKDEDLADRIHEITPKATGRI